MIEALLVIAAVAAVVWIVTAPLRGGAARADDAAMLRKAELEAAKESKYREIRDAEMDFRTGKLSEADWRATDRDLRAEAMVILSELDELSADPS